MVNELPTLEVSPVPAAAPEPLVDVLVRILVADGLSAHRTGVDRFEVSAASGPAMEWCCVSDVLFGRSTAEYGEASWVHRLDAGTATAPFEIGRKLAVIVRSRA